MEDIVLQNQWIKVKKILAGGKERYHSSLAAINAYENDNDNLIFHDAVRPLVSNKIIENCIKALNTYDAVDVAIKATDTIIESSTNNFITSIPNRHNLRNGQTPQCFKRGIIKKAYSYALNDPNFITTDDCGVVLKYLPETPIYIVEGESSNMKVTYPEDLFLIDKYFQLKTIQDNHKLLPYANEQMRGKVLIVYGGSYGIGEEIVKLGKKLGAKVYSFSRSLNNIDVSNIEDVQKSLENIYNKNGHIDYVVSTAGILIKEPLFSMTNEDILKSVFINYIGAVNVCKEAFKYLQKSKGSLLLYTSSSYTRGRMMYSVYSSTKAAIVNLVQALSEEWHSTGIRINCINPERTKTPMRVRSFGIEPDESLLKAEIVGIASINTLISDYTGEVVDVRRE